MEAASEPEVASESAAEPEPAAEAAPEPEAASEPSPEPEPEAVPERSAQPESAAASEVEPAAELDEPQPPARSPPTRSEGHRELLPAHAPVVAFEVAGDLASMDEAAQAELKAAAVSSLGVDPTLVDRVELQ